MVGKQARTNSTNESRAPGGNEEKSNPQVNNKPSKSTYIYIAYAFQAIEDSEITTPAKPKKPTNAEALTKVRIFVNATLPPSLI